MVKTSIAHNKYLTSRVKEDNDSISTKSEAQILSLSLNLVYNFLFKNFLITGLCNSWASTSFKFA